MLMHDNIQNAFGKADQGFENAIYKALDTIQRNEVRKPMKRVSVRVVLIAAVLCVLLTAVAYAAINRLGILDYITERRGVTVLPEASELVQKDIEQAGGQTEFASFSVRQAILDGTYAYIVVAVTPASPDIFLMGADAGPGDNIGNMGQIYADETGSIADYAKANQKKLVHVNIYTQAEEQGTPFINSLDYLHEEDGTLVYMLQGGFTGGGDTAKMDLICLSMSYDDNMMLDMESQQRESLSCTLSVSAPQSAVSSKDAKEYADCGVRIDTVTLSDSPMAVYAEITFTVIDAEKYAAMDSGLWFEFLDDNGKRMADGATGTGSIEALDDSQARFIQKTNLQAAQNLPATVTLRAYNCWDKVRYETHSFEMQ